METLKLSSGCTILNLACSGHADYFILSGMFYLMVGDSSSGKTFLTLTALAEASINKKFDNYDLIYDNAEDGALMDVEKFFGKKLATRLKPPKSNSNDPVYSDTIEEFYFNMFDWIESSKKTNRPFIYLLDSFDALSSKYEGEKFAEARTASRKGKKPTGDYGDGKAKVNSRWIRRVRQGLKKTNSILIGLSQTRDNVGGGMFDQKSTMAGGRSLKFYAAWQLWSSVGQTLKKEVNGKERQIGITARIKIKKNRLSGKEWTVEIPIYWSHGIDNIGSCIDYLVDEGHWKKAGAVISAPDLKFEGRRGILLDKIETEKLELDLHSIVEDVWKDVERQCAVPMKNKYNS